MTFTKWTFSALIGLFAIITAPEFGLCDTPEPSWPFFQKDGKTLHYFKDFEITLHEQRKQLGAFSADVFGNNLIDPKIVDHRQLKQQFSRKNKSELSGMAQVLELRKRHSLNNFNSEISLIYVHSNFSKEEINDLRNFGITLHGDLQTQSHPQDSVARPSFYVATVKYSALPYVNRFSKIISVQSYEVKWTSILELGANPYNIDREDCVLYSTERLEISRNQIAQLLQAGIVINSDLWIPPVQVNGKITHPYGFHSATIKYSAFPNLKKTLDNILGSKVVHVATAEWPTDPQSDLGGLFINSSQVKNGTGISAPRNGAGVRMAIIDNGMDISSTDLPPPFETFDTSIGFNVDTWATDITPGVSGHGHHVAGIAVGNGGFSGGRYAGSAPGADIAVYKVFDDSGAGFTSDQIEAFNRAGVVGVDIISMSSGAFSTYMDGSSNIAQTLDSLRIDNDIVSFISAGNEADDNEHFSVDLPPGQMTEFEYVIDNTDSDSHYLSINTLRIIWKDDDPSDRQVVIQLLNPMPGDILTTPLVGTSPRSTETRHYDLRPVVLAGESRTFNFRLTNIAASGDTPKVHIFASSGIGEFPEGVADPNFTVRVPALADLAISIGNFSIRDIWTDWTGMEQMSTAPSGAIAPSSSLGPRIDGHSVPSGVTSGNAVISLRYEPVDQNDSTIIDDDGENLNGTGPAHYRVRSGTSMAAPLAAGGFALILEAVNDLNTTYGYNITKQDALWHYLITSDGPNGTRWDPTHGFGFFNVLRAIQSLEDCALPANDNNRNNSPFQISNDFSNNNQDEISPRLCPIDLNGDGVIDLINDIPGMVDDLAGP